MAERVTSKQLDRLATVMNIKLGRPEAYMGPDMETVNGREVRKINIGHLHVDKTYSGYALMEVVNSGGAVSYVSPSFERMTAREMQKFLLGMIASLDIEEYKLGLKY